MRTSRISPSERVIANGLGLEEVVAGWFPEAEVFGGMAFTCINRGEPGIVNHIDYGAVTIGHLGDDPEQLDEALALWDGHTAVWPPHRLWVNLK